MIYLATDHRGFELKEKLKKYLEELGYEYEDLGAFEYNADDDYPDFVQKAALKVSENPEYNKAIVLGASGQGEAIAANRYRNVRAAVYYGGPATAGGPEEIIKLSREHNDANVLSLGASFLDEASAKAAVKSWLETPFSKEERHMRRIEKIDQHG